MNQESRGEVGSTPESIEDQKYAELQKAMSEQERLLKEMDGADKIKLEDLMAQMDVANKRYEEVWKAYKQAVEDAHQKEVSEEEALRRKVSEE